jgi:hypothetical protein
MSEHTNAETDKRRNNKTMSSEAMAQNTPVHVLGQRLVGKCRELPRDAPTECRIPVTVKKEKPHPRE